MEEKSGVWGKLRPVWAFVQKHAVLCTLLLVLLLQFVPNDAGTYPWGGIWMRMKVKELAVADSAAASSVDNYLNQQIAPALKPDKTMFLRYASANAESTPSFLHVFIIFNVFPPPT